MSSEVSKAAGTASPEVAALELSLGRPGDSNRESLSAYFVQAHSILEIADASGRRSAFHHSP